LRDAVNQEDFVQAVVGDDPKLYQICHAMFGCGLPGIVEMPAVTKSIEESKKAISAAGYKGEKIVVLDSTDVSFLSSGARIGADLMKRLGMNVELQSMDFATLAQRRTNLEPVEKGGWSMFCTSADLPALQNPGVNYYIRSGWVGGYKNDEIDNLTERWVSATEPADAQRTFEQIQRASYDDTPMIPLGLFDLRTAYSKSLTGVLPCSSAVFWNVKRA
jgi:peptide/nickel transport system substrate-binding protein